MTRPHLIASAALALTLAWLASPAAGQAPAVTPLAPAAAASAPAEAGAPAPAASAPVAKPPPDEATLARSLAHCSAAFHVIANAPRELGLLNLRDDARALTRLSMLGTHALLGKAGLEAVKQEQGALHSKLTLTQPANQERILMGEFSICRQMLDLNRSYIIQRIKQAERQP